MPSCNINSIVLDATQGVTSGVPSDQPNSNVQTIRGKRSLLNLLH